MYQNDIERYQWTENNLRLFNNIIFSQKFFHMALNFMYVKFKHFIRYDDRGYQKYESHFYIVIW